MRQRPDGDIPQRHRFAGPLLCRGEQRVNIRQRQAEGIAAAKARGVRFGRQEKELPDNFGHIVSEWEEKRISCGEATAMCGMSESTFYRRVREYRLSAKN